MRLGISTASFFSRMVTEDSLAFIGQNGVKVAEVFFDSMCEYTPEFAALIKEQAEAYGIEIVSVHAMSMQFEPQLFSIGKRQREDAWKLYESVLRSARTLGADKYVMHGQATLGGALRNAQLDRIVPIADDLAELARSYGVRLCWENVSWANFCEPDFAPMLIGRTKSDNLCFTLDVKQALRSGYDPLVYVDAMGERLAHVHLCDFFFDAVGQPHYTLPLRGQYDFTGLVDALRSLNYAGDLVIEAYSDLYADPLEVIVCRDRAAVAMGLD